MPCLEAFYPKLNAGAIIVADNMIYASGEGTLQYAKAIRAKRGMTSVLLPVGSGIEVSRLQGVTGAPQSANASASYSLFHGTGRPLGGAIALCEVS